MRDRWNLLHHPPLKPGFHYTSNATTTTQTQSDYKVEQKFVVVVVVIGLIETRLDRKDKIYFYVTD